ncbi:cation transporter [Streptomyces sp. NBRC 110611]|nr:cation transporter [Streptomyces sp. NBRC 110611]
MPQSPFSHEPSTELAESLQDIVKDHRLSAAQEWLETHPPYVIADELARMDAVDAGVAFRLLQKDRALAVFEKLEPIDQQQILEGLRNRSFLDLVEGMDPDDRARMLREAPAKVAKRVLAGLSPNERRMTSALLGYPEGSVGRYMTPEVVALAQDLTVEQALRTLRAKGSGDERAKVRAHPGHRGGGPHHPARLLLPDERELLLRGLLQAGGDHLRLGAVHRSGRGRRLRPGPGADLGDRAPQR